MLYIPKKFYRHQERKITNILNVNKKKITSNLDRNILNEYNTLYSKTLSFYFLLEQYSLVIAEF